MLCGNLKKNDCDAMVRLVMESNSMWGCFKGCILGTFSLLLVCLLVCLGFRDVFGGVVRKNIVKFAELQRRVGLLGVLGVVKNNPKCTGANVNEI